MKHIPVLQRIEVTSVYHVFYHPQAEAFLSFEDISFLKPSSSVARPAYVVRFCFFSL